MSLKGSNRKRARTVTQFIRGLVSKKKIRYQQDGFDLDLTYITEKIIAMGLPSQGTEGIYRNPISEVVKFFKKYHSDRYLIVNLCEKDYDVSHFDGNVVFFRFKDHNPPELKKLFEFFLKMDEYFLKDKNNLVAFHCKAGKGRTGTIICMYLMHCKEFSKTSGSLNYYGKLRTKNGKGVTIPSQRRYVRYYENCLRKGFPVEDRVVTLEKIVMETIPHFDKDGGCHPYLKIEDIEETKLYDESKGKKKFKKFSKKDAKVVLTGYQNFDLAGDCKFLLFDHDPLKKDEKLCWFWLNTNFITKEKTFVSLAKKSIDGAVKDKNHKRFDPDFSITCYFKIKHLGKRQKKLPKETPELDLFDISEIKN